MSTIVKSSVDVWLAVWICFPANPINDGEYQINTNEYDWVDHVQQFNREAAYHGVDNNYYRVQSMCIERNVVKVMSRYID